MFLSVKFFFSPYSFLIIQARRLVFEGGSNVRVHVLPFIFDYVIMCKILSLCLRWFRFFVVTHIYIIASSNPHSCCHHSFVSSNYRVSVNMGVLSL